MSSASGLALLHEPLPRLDALCIFPFPGLPIPQSGTARRLADMGCLSVHIEPQQLMHHGEFGIAAARSLVR